MGKLFIVEPHDNLLNGNLELKEFMEKYSLRLQSVVKSCTNQTQLENAEKYIRNGLQHELRNPDMFLVNEYVRLLIKPKELEFEAIYNGGTK